MRSLAFLILVSALALAAGDGFDGNHASIHGTPPAGTDDITLTLLNTWDPVVKALGLDVFEDATDTYVLGVNNNDDLVRAYDAATGAPLGSLTLDAGNTNAFGIAWNNDPTNDTYYVDDFVSSFLFYTDDFGTSWTTLSNPAGSNARGMDFDGTDYWTTNGEGGGLWRFQPGVGQDNLTIPEVTAQPSGLAVFPYEGDVGVAVTTYNSFNIWFYVWDGVDLTYLGSAPCPAGCSSSLGLTYSYNTDTMFWSYITGSGYKVSEFSVDFGTALQHDTWGAIKSAF